MLSNIFDSHAHYTDSAFDSDRDELLDSILPEKGVCKIVTVASSIEDAKKCTELAGKHKNVYAACGVHPEAEAETPDDFIGELESIIRSSSRVKALGEIGLDYHYENYNKERQIKLFENQLILASELKLPVIVHSRNASEDTMTLLRKYRPNGVVHCFSGSAETAEEIISLGMHISFTGVLTFKNAKKALRALERIPLERLMLETDCPYMAPEPYRGQRCDSSMISETAKKAAEIKNISAQEMLDITCKNAYRFFGIENE